MGSRWEGKIVLDSGLWVQCDLLFTVTSGKAQCQGQGDGGQLSPTISTIENSWDKFLSDCVQLKETTFRLHRLFYLWALSLLLFSGRVWVSTTVKLWRARKPTWFSNVLLSLCMPNIKSSNFKFFLKGKPLGPDLNWEIYLNSVLRSQNNAMG